MTAVVLGSAAGGGVPQWNCRCEVCERARRPGGSVRARTQTCVAVSADGERWVLLNAPPDLRQQILETAALAPRSGNGLRHSPVAGVVLTGAEIDQAAGLLHLREAQPFTTLASGYVHTVLATNPMFEALDEAVVERRTLLPATPVELAGLTVELFPVPGKVPLWLEQAVGDAPADGAVMGVSIEAGGRSLVFVPEVAAIVPAIRARLAAADVVLIDGTLFTDDEMIRSGTGRKTGRRMGHLPIAGEDGSLRTLSFLRKRRIYIHLNNTNPVLIEDSPERRVVADAGWEIATDGMEIAP
ncbi:pyrroloquinoline quinone biosynthesis protein PqqB [Rhodoplanes roseus]|uniref:Coenzyme PQQ synthesis protein B n=1 Tax=Rhodoplanes roseus TaxID=29409 RepID=A0A327L0U1_9BRAD|nr:pyrroloquinoline quinone biosynthesis protein PqqB [Rhodoplanes roseus]RAI41288.1 pyrroloquinoline quinone biosynthesis protein PqqB [Rhodoplanes roseus]